MSGFPFDLGLGRETVGLEAAAPPVEDRRRRGRRPLRVAAAVLTVGLLAAAGLTAAPPVELTQAGPVAFDDGTVNRTIETFDARGVYAIRYVHQREAEIHLPVRNDGWLPTTVSAVAMDGRPAPMIEPLGGVGLPLELAPGRSATLSLRVRFDNCEFYTERAVDSYGAVHVTTRTAGITRTTAVELDHDVLVRSPVMVTCPDRVSDRGAFLRGG